MKALVGLSKVGHVCMCTRGVRVHACVHVTVVASFIDYKILLSFHHVEFVFVVVLLQLGVC